MSLTQTWVNNFVSFITEKNHDLKLQINLCLTINELNLINVSTVTE